MLHLFFFTNFEGMDQMEGLRRGGESSQSKQMHLCVHVPVRACAGRGPRFARATDLFELQTSEGTRE